jgi:osmotically-inducible protein OsmY
MKSSTIAAGLAFIVALSGCTASQQERAKSTANDAFIAAQVRAKIAAVDPATVSLVQIGVENRRVTLEGQVHSDQERARVDQAVRGITGVAGIDDRLRVNPKAPTANEIAADLELQTRVQAAIAAQTGVNALKINVSAHNGVVMLGGTVASNTIHTLVTQTVRSVSGVARIVDRLRLQR